MDCDRCPFYAAMHSAFDAKKEAPRHICLLMPEAGVCFDDCGYPRGTGGREKFDALRAELIGALTCAADRLREARYDTMGR